MGDLEHHVLGLVDGLYDVFGPVEGNLGDLVANTDEPAQKGVLSDDLGVLAGAGDGRCLSLQVDQHRGTAQPLEQAAAIEQIGDRDDVGLVAGAIQSGYGFEDVLMGGPVELNGFDVLEGDGDGISRQQHDAEKRLFDLDVVGWRARGAPLDVGIGGHRHPCPDLVDTHCRLSSLTAMAKRPEWGTCPLS